jgi:hypothetical protein
MKLYIIILNGLIILLVLAISISLFFYTLVFYKEIVTI